MTDRKFIELIFDLDFKSAAGYKLAYRSLTESPQQLFCLFIDKEESATFFSAFKLYGGRLAKLLDGFFKYDGPSEHRLPIGKGDLSLRLLEEVLAAFVFALFANEFSDAVSQESMAAIVMAVIKLSKPVGSLGLLGSKLGEAPLILSRLISDGRVGKWSRSQPASFERIVSNDLTLGSWAETIANNLNARDCALHSRFTASQASRDWGKMRDLVQSYPCEKCRVPSGAIVNPLPRYKNVNPYGINSGIRVFDSLLGQHIGPWKIVLSEQALRDLKEAARNENSDQIQAGLLALASGEWMRKSLRRPAGNENDYRVPVYKVGCQGGFIIWQVDVAFDERHDHNMQVVKVWTICTPAEVEDMCVWVIRAQYSFTDSRVAACQTNLKSAKGTVYPTAVFLPDHPKNPSDEDFTAETATKTSWDPAIKAVWTPPTPLNRGIVKGSPILGKFYSLTTTVLENIHPEASSAIFPVDPSREEFHVINHFESPAFILGSSGTGKTTCLIYKLASRYLSSKELDETPVRQLLLTRSKDLAPKLKLYTKRLINTRLGVIAEHRGEDDEAGRNEDTRQDLLALNEADFPLVCTFNYFLTLLENLIRIWDRRNTSMATTLKLVDFTTFSIEYWRRLPTVLTRRIPMDLAFIDMMGVIKGSASIDSNLQPLSRDAYITKCWKLAPNFSTETDRRAVYSLYEDYEKIKMGRKEVDDTDRVIRVFEALRKYPELHRTVETFLDEVYVDEVQDQRPLEIELLLTLIRDPWGIHFAGDTAQSMSKDSLFRFANTKALFYTRFSNLMSTTRKKSWLIPKLLPLSHNYRSHKGILAVASVLMTLLYTAFPELVDKLPPEIGDQIGPRPTLFVGSGLVSALSEPETEVISYSGKLAATKKNSTDEDTEKTAFGGLRVILVRDEDTQRELQKQVPKSTLVFTILQSKGMEFEDVFLYNFFTTSPYSSDFKVLGDLLYEHHSSMNGSLTRYVNWEKVNSILCSELKHIYVAVTRAQNRLWIVESKEKIVLPIINMFNEIVPRLFPQRYPNSLLEVIREKFANVSDLRKLFHSTDQKTVAEWRELAHELLAKKAYIQAGLCFENAQDLPGVALAEAYLTELKGMEHRASGLKKEFTVTFEKACVLFIKGGRISKAVECYEALGNIPATAEVLSENGRHEEAAWLFIAAGNFKKAAREYAELGKHEMVLVTCYHAGLYNELAIYLKHFGSRINPYCLKQFSRLCYLLSLQHKFKPELQNTITQALGSEAEQEAVFREFGMMNHVFELYKRQKRFANAYEIAVDIGFLEDAVMLADDHGLLNTASQPVLRRVFDYVVVGRSLANIPHLSSTKRNQKPSIRRPNSKTLGSLDRGWNTYITSLTKYTQNGEKPNRSHLNDGVLRSLFDIHATLETPNIRNMPQDLTSLPLEFIGGAIGILNTIITEKRLPSPALLYLGIFETPTRPGQYIALPWSPIGTAPKLGFPIQYLDIDTARDVGCRLICGIVSRALAFVEEKSRKHFEGRGPSGKLSTGQFSASLRALVSLNLLFLNLRTILSSIQNHTEPVMSHRRFWMQTLIEQMAFISSYEQATIVAEIKSQLASALEFTELYDNLKKYFLSHLQFKRHSQTQFDFLSYLLHQMQFAVSFGIEDEFRTTMKSNDIHRLRFDLPSVVQLVTHARDTLIKTTLGDFPGNFCENVCILLSKLRQVQDSGPYELFYSPSIISLYEELVSLLIFLIRPIYFVIPRSWSVLYLPKHIEIPRSTSERARLCYQDILIKVTVSFCELVARIENTPSSRLAKADTLARRCLDLLVISIINVGTVYPRPAKYPLMWDHVQKVFKNPSLKARPLVNVPAESLLQNLAKAFTLYDGKDRLGVIVTDGYQLPNDFAGLSLERLGLAVKYAGIAKPLRRRPIPLNANLKIRELNSAYLITRLWRTDGPEFVKRMRPRRERRERAACLITLFWRTHGPQLIRRIQIERENSAYERSINRRKHNVCKNCCLLAEMGFRKDSIY